MSHRATARLIGFLLTLCIVFLLSRLIIRSLPGDPIETLIGESGTRLSADILKADLHLDQPFLKSLILDGKKWLSGDFGLSIIKRVPITDLLGARITATLKLSGLALLLGLIASFAIGLGSCFQDKWSRRIDRFCTWYGSLAAALPTVWLGPVMIYCFALLIPIFPLGDDIRLPALSLAFGISGVWSRLIRERVKDQLSSGGMFGAASAARSRGVAEWKIVIKYGFIPASGALAAYFGTQVGSLFAGTVITEIVFNYPGMGSLMVNAVLSRDYPLVEASVFVGACFCLLGTLAGDLLRMLIDPRTAQGPRVRV